MYLIIISCPLALYAPYANLAHQQNISFTLEALSFPCDSKKNSLKFTVRGYDKSFPLKDVELELQ